MRLILLLPLVLPLLLAAACRSTNPAQGPFAAVPPVGPLGTKVRAAIAVINKDHAVRLGERLLLDFKLTNISNADAIVYNELEPGWLVAIQIAGADGKFVESPAPDKLRRGRTGKYHYACLPPGAFVGTTYAVRPDDPRWDLEPGRYWVRIVYQNGFEPCLASPFFGDSDLEELKTRAVVPLLTGLIVSNVEQFDVTD